MKVELSTKNHPLDRLGAFLKFLRAAIAILLVGRAKMEFDEIESQPDGDAKTENGRRGHDATDNH